ncbi:Protein kinase-like domain containing protein [Tylopilus felleus]
MLDHINVLPLIWASVEPGRFTMVSPWAEKGTLTSYIDVMHNRLTDVQVLTLIYDVAAGLHYLHSSDIIHGSLYGSAVVIDADGTALLSHYGLSTLVDERGFPLFGQLEPELGTVRWTAPECLTGENGSATRNVPTKKSDIYSFGSIMLQQVLSGKIPYHYYERGEDIMSAISRRETPTRPDDRRLSDDRWMFIQECWSSISNLRPSSMEIVEFAKHDLNLYSETVTPKGDPNQPTSDEYNKSGVPAT